ncbi:amidohydrolase family protein [Paralimibaculum aggregatum]|uniref:Amidohydrolase family protein n=2 Tax=Paralimibaculum aggregatum TaxID=3036245 RepID=A0ABQ6LQH3_9RHOB|nr:amidohydrolase family protein [Limibaculum sp. NKW23]
MSDDGDARTTVVHGDWVVAHDGEDHRIIEDGVVVYRGDRIIHVGRDWSGDADGVVRGRRRLVIPGLISTHTHLRINEGYRMVIDGGRRNFLRSGFTNYAGSKLDGGPTFLAPTNHEEAIRFCLSTHLLAGVTTILEMDDGAPDDGETVAALAAECGIRMAYSPAFSAAGYRYAPDGRLVQQWDEKAGFEGLEKAVGFIETRCDADSRLTGILVLNEFFASTPELRRRTREAATRLGVPITTHFAEQLYEFHHTLRETGLTPVELLSREGFLGADVILGHGIYLGGHSMTAYPFPGDLETIAASGASVAHSPVAYARRGFALETFKRYIDHGINMALGTDTFPTDVISEMRMAALVGKLLERNNEEPAARDVFRAATTGGARALGRDDIGRLSAGAKADITIVDFDNHTIGPVIDPIRALVYSGTGDMVDRVVIDGRTVVADKRLRPWDQAAVLDAAWANAERVWGSFSDYHWAGRTVEEVFPPSFAGWTGS